METDIFFDAVKRGDVQQVDRLLAGQPDLLAARTGAGLSAVLLAIYYGQPAVANLLIERGAELDIFEAAAAGRLERVTAWLDSDPSLVYAYAGDGFQALGLASFFGHKSVVDALIRRGAQVGSASHNPQNVQPLHSAVAGKHFEIARTLLEHGADANACQSGGFTPLHAAAQNGQMEMIRLLLEHGANPGVVSSAGKTPLDFALENGHDLAAGLLRA